MDERFIREVQENTRRQKEITQQLKKLSNQFMRSGNRREREMISLRIQEIKEELKRINARSADSARKLSIYKNLPTPMPGGKFKKLPKIEDSLDPNQNPMIKHAKKQETNPVQNIPQNKSGSNMSRYFQTDSSHKKEKRRDYEEKDEDDLLKKKKKGKFDLTDLEKETIRRMKKPEKDKKKSKKEKGFRKPHKHVQIASKMFYSFSQKLIRKNKFKKIRRELVRSNLEFVPANYISFMLFITFVSFIVSLFILGFFLFFSLIALPPFLIHTETPFFTRLLQTFWIPILLPIVAYFFMYFYPSMERGVLEAKIDRELPFATIHMSSISSSLVEPSKIFEIIVTTKEYPTISKEFTKLLNEINIYGYDLVSALKNIAFNSPSKKLAELFNGLATTITSGGNLPEFFEKRSQTLLLEHRLEREKQSKAAETFMDIYISVVIAAPMILMLLLIMMRVSGLGISLSTGMITIVMISGVTLLNVVFLIFLHLKQPGGAG